jgi:hypothetical protein
MELVEKGQLIAAATLATLSLGRLIAADTLHPG